MKPAEVIPAFDVFLGERGLTLEATVIGGAALGLMKVTGRDTKDCDILSPALSPVVKEAAVAFAIESRRAGRDLDEKWLNNGPASLGPLLPRGWEARRLPLFQGKALRLDTLGRADFLKTKLFAFCDRDLDLQDCLLLAPTRGELMEAEPWVAAQDGNPDWPTHVRGQINVLSRRLRHAF
jgi:hypothetical protein